MKVARVVREPKDIVGIYISKLRKMSISISSFVTGYIKNILYRSILKACPLQHSNTPAILSHNTKLNQMSKTTLIQEI